MPKGSAAESLKKEFFNVSLAVLGIIQGLSLNQLAVKISDSHLISFSIDSIYVLPHYVLCFLIILRVFQTYLLAALDYNGWKYSIFEVFTIFFVGILEYWVFDALGNIDNMDPTILHARLSVLFLIASASHLKALFQIRSGFLTTDKDFIDNETIIQIYNFALPTLASSMCIFSYFFARSTTLIMAVSILAAIATSFNIFTSLKYTMRGA